jgi:hypothetical protein
VGYRRGVDAEVVSRLAAVRTIEITTVGRRSGRPVRIEIWWFYFEGRFIITGTPGPRDWLANVTSDPRIVVHALGEDYQAAVAFVDDTTFRRRFFAQSTPEVRWYTEQARGTDLVARAPMVEVIFSD